MVGNFDHADHFFLEYDANLYLSFRRNVDVHVTLEHHYEQFTRVKNNLTGPEVWRHGWRQLFLVRSQATVTSPLERFIYYFFYQIVANGSVRLSGAGVMMWECTFDVSG